VPADVDGVGLGVVAEGDRDDMRHAVVTDGGQPPEPLAPEVGDLGITEHAHSVLLFGVGLYHAGRQGAVAANGSPGCIFQACQGEHALIAGVEPGAQMLLLVPAAAGAFERG
jgi:hypothetical protein